MCVCVRGEGGAAVVRVTRVRAAAAAGYEGCTRGEQSTPLTALFVPSVMALHGTHIGPVAARGESTTHYPVRL